MMTETESDRVGSENVIAEGEQASVSEPSEEHEIRVLITGVDTEGRSRVVGAERVQMNSNEAAPGLFFANVFETGSAPPPARPHGHGEQLPIGLAPGLVQWQVVDIPPGQGHPLHHTDTVDLDIVLAGSIELTLDDGMHVLRPGDGVVINGVDHGWLAGPDGARLSVIFIGTPPPA